jgi:hypothetical protein
MLRLLLPLKQLRFMSMCEIIINTAGAAPSAMVGIDEIHFGNANTNPNSYELVETLRTLLLGRKLWLLTR